MSMFEMMTDAGLYLLFFGFGLLSGAFLFYVDEVKRKRGRQ